MSWSPRECVLFLSKKKLQIMKIIWETEKVYFRSQILERPSIGEYWNISGVPVLPENAIFTFFRMCWCYSEAYNTGKQKWSSIVQYSCTSIWDLKYTFPWETFQNLYQWCCLPVNDKLCRFQIMNMQIAIYRLFWMHCYLFLFHWKDQTDGGNMTFS